MVAQLDRRRIANAKAVEIAGLVALCVVAVVGALVAADAYVPAGLQ